RRTPAIPTDWLVAELGSLIHRKAIVGARELAEMFGRDDFAVGIQIEIAGRLFAVMAVDTASHKDRFHVTPVFDVERRLRISQAGLVVRVPLLLALVFRFL